MSKGLKALKRLRQETIPATYMLHFDKNECIEIIEKELNTLEILKKYIYYSKKSHCIRMREIRKSINNFDYEDLKEIFEGSKNNG